MAEQTLCGLCGDPMPAGEEMFNYHGHSGPCPKPPKMDGTSLAKKLLDCPKCKGAAPLMTPLKVVEERNAIYGCKACGFTFRADGGAFVENVEKLRDYFRGAEMGQMTLIDALAGERLNPATKVLLQAQLVAYGLQMWNDGLKTGLLMGATALEQKEKAP